MVYAFSSFSSFLLPSLLNSPSSRQAMAHASLKLLPVELRRTVKLRPLPLPTPLECWALYLLPAVLGTEPRASAR